MIGNMEDPLDTSDYEDDLELLSDEMASIFGQKDESEDGDEAESNTATFPSLNQLFGGSHLPAKQPKEPSEPAPQQPQEEEGGKKKKSKIESCI